MIKKMHDYDITKIMNGKKIFYKPQNIKSENAPTYEIAYNEDDKKFFVIDYFGTTDYYFTYPGETKEDKIKFKNILNVYLTHGTLEWH